MSKKSKANYSLNVKGYSLKIIRDTGDSTHNTFSHVFRKSEKDSLFGTSHNDKSTDGQILDWANNRLVEFLNGNDNKELLVFI